MQTAKASTMVTICLFQANCVFCVPVNHGQLCQYATQRYVFSKKNNNRIIRKPTI